MDALFQILCILFGFGGCGRRCFGLDLFNFIREARCQHHGTMLTNILSTHSQCRSTNIFTTLALKYLYAHQIFFLLTKYFSAAPIALPGGTTEISDIFDVLAGGEDDGTVRYRTLQYNTVQCSTTLLVRRFLLGFNGEDASVSLLSGVDGFMPGASMEVGGVMCSAPSVPQPVVQSRRRPLLGPSPG